jgi:DNA (cytosine-5)-methyltransferase 1
MRKEDLNHKYSLVSLFCGCGGLDHGFENNGFKILRAFDNDKSSIETYNFNLSPVAKQIDVTSQQFKNELEKVGECTVVVGGFPCQGFSKSGPKNVNDPRNLLYRSMVEAIKTLNPVMFLAENVDGLKQNFNGKYLEQIKSDFEGEGYTVENRILNSLGFGTAQHRRRIFFVGYKNGVKWKWPSYQFSFETRNGERDYELPLLNSSGVPKKKHRTIKMVLQDLEDISLNIPNHECTTWKLESSKVIEKIGQGQKLCNVRFSKTSVYTWEIPEVFGETSGIEKSILITIAKNRRKKQYGSVPNGNPLSIATIEELSGLKGIDSYINALLEKNYLKDVGGKYDLKGATFCSGIYKRPLWNDASPTVLTNFHNPRYFIHPTQDRPFSVRECARLQGFPDAFIFQGAILEQYKQVGNAVPPPLSEALACAIFNSLEMFRNHSELKNTGSQCRGDSYELPRRKDSRAEAP